MLSGSQFSVIWSAERNPWAKLAEIVGLSSSALSQHLGKMRALNLVKTKREGHTIYYQLASREVREILKTLRRLYGEPR